MIEDLVKTFEEEEPLIGTEIKTNMEIKVDKEKGTNMIEEMAVLKEKTEITRGLTLVGKIKVMEEVAQFQEGVLPMGIETNPQTLNHPVTGTDSLHLLTEMANQSVTLLAEEPSTWAEEVVAPQAEVVQR